MLSLRYPDILSALDFPGGLRALALVGDKKPVLVVKAPKEYLFTAQLNKGFKVYVVPVNICGRITVSIVSTFFDDEDEPLTLRTPLFDEPDCTLLKSTLLGNELDVYLSDEHNQEMLSYSADAVVPEATRTLFGDSHLFPYDVSIARTMLDGRQPSLDEEALTTTQQLSP